MRNYFYGVFIVRGFRFILVLLILGGVGFYKGVQELNVRLASGRTPLNVELLELESGMIPETYFLEIGSHWAVYDALIYSYNEGQRNDSSDELKLNYAFYPVISDQHPYNVAIDKLLEEYGNNVPEKLIPEFRNFTVLVKTKRFKTVGDIPANWDYMESIEGLVINRLGKLESDEKALILDIFPALDLDTVLILEEGRSVSSIGLLILYFAGGGLFILGGLFLIFNKVRQAKTLKASKASENQSSKPETTDGDEFHNTIS